MLLKFAYQDFLGDRRFKNTTKQKVFKPNKDCMFLLKFYFVSVVHPPAERNITSPWKKTINKNWREKEIGSFISNRDLKENIIC